ncbi:MAG: hypothetical protein RSB95_02965 [Bacilli bacterium]
MKKTIGLLILAGLVGGLSSCNGYFTDGTTSKDQPTSVESITNNTENTELPVDTSTGIPAANYLAAPQKVIDTFGFDLNIEDILTKLQLNNDTIGMITTLMNKVEEIIKNGVDVDLTSTPSEREEYETKSILSISGITESPISLTLYYNAETTTDSHHHHHGHNHDDWDNEDWENVEDDEDDIKNGEFGDGCNYDGDDKKGKRNNNWEDNYDDEDDEDDNECGHHHGHGHGYGHDTVKGFETSTAVNGIALLDKFQLSFVGELEFDSKGNSSIDISLITSDTTYLDLRASHEIHKHRIEDELAFTFVKDDVMVADLGFQLELNDHKMELEFYLNDFEIEIERKTRRHGTVVYEVEVTDAEGNSFYLRFKRVVSHNHKTGEETAEVIDY